MGIRKHYVTLCFMDDTEVTYIDRDGTIEVTFEKAVDSGFHHITCTIDGTIISEEGFNEKDKEFIMDFLRNNAPVIKDEVAGEYD